MPGRRHGNGQDWSGGKSVMSRMGAFYVIKAMDGDAAGSGHGVPGRRAAGRRVPAAGRRGGSIFSLARVLAVVHRDIGGAHGRAGLRRHGLGGAASAD